MAAPAESTEQLSPVLRDYTADSDCMLIVFSGLKRNPEKVPDFSFVRVTAGLAAKKLFLRDLRKAWFLRGLPGISRDVAGTAAFLRGEVELQKARRVVLVGYSMGGFAAHVFAGLLGATAETFSPQTFLTVWQRFKAGDHRWRRYVLKLQLGMPRRFLDVAGFIHGSGSRHVIHYALDSRLDEAHARHIESAPNVQLVPHAEGSHRLVTALRDSGMLRELLEKAVSAPGYNDSPSGGGRL